MFAKVAGNPHNFLTMRRQNSEQSKQHLSATMLALRTANKKRPCAICLRKVGFGMTRTCRALEVGKATVSRWYKQAGIAINPERNGVALHGRGLRARLVRAMILVEKRRAIRLKRLIQAMERVSRRERTTPCPTKGMTDAEAFGYRYRNDIQFRLKHLLRRRIRKVIETGVKCGSSIDLLGCSTGEFKRHIENQFKDGMSWDNQGEWELDHCKPCAAFDLTLAEDQRRCFHWSNYRPLWRADNRAKNSFFNGRFIRRERAVHSGSCWHD